MDPLPSFDRADYVSAPTPVSTTLDSTTEFSRVASHAAYVKAIMFGIGAAIAGCILYAIVEIATGWTIGYLALAVGFMVGKAIKAGSGGRGGRRYQIAAALLTYASVSMAAIPVALHEASKQPIQQQVQPQPQTPTANPGGEKFPFPEDSSAQAAPSTGPANAPAHGLLYFLGTLLFVGLASPFMELADGFGGVIGLVILFVGIRAAWQLTAGTEEAMGQPSSDSSSPTTLSLR